MSPQRPEEKPAALRLGIFGGSFDPVHLGHLMVAHAAREETRLDEIMFVPTNRSPFKTEATPASAPVRLRLLRLALAGLPWCSVNDIEARREGVSYSVDTVRAIAKARPEATLLYLIGGDNVPTLGQWRDAEELARRVEFVALPRPGADCPEPPPGFVVHWLKGWPLEVSSSDIRSRVRAGRAFEHLVPAAVAELIRNNGLYL